MANIKKQKQYGTANRHYGKPTYGHGRQLDPNRVVNVMGNICMGLIGVIGIALGGKVVDKFR